MDEVFNNRISLGINGHYIRECGHVDLKGMSWKVPTAEASSSSLSIKSVNS